MILNRNDAMYAANIFADYFANFENIEDYLRRVKADRMANYPVSLPGLGPEDDMFQDFTVNPNDMDFVCREVDTQLFNRYFEITTSHAAEDSIPGKTLKWVVYEKNSNQIVGFIRFGSPTINSKPRNEFLGKPLNTQDKDVMKRFNDSCIMGFSIVPTQPFGFNYLGGKLLAGICCSHLARRTLNKKYGGPFCMFETTSLYGSTKSSSQYDGMKPFLRYKGLTESNFTPSINDENYQKLNKWFIEKNDGEMLVHKEASSRKLKTQTKMISIIKESLKKSDETEYKKFLKVFEDAKGLTQQKRQYMSDFGYENTKDYFNLETDTLIKKENFDRYEFDSIVEWWKKKATTRFENLKSDGRLRTELETWNKNMNIDIIR
tara:strand:- start:2381 stop:3508 length:1128 start_codon:yes stop_codon:yes gene_type:complete